MKAIPTLPSADLTEVVDDEAADGLVRDGLVQPGYRAPPTCAASKRDFQKTFVRTSRSCSSAVSNGPTGRAA